jgi:prepilin-type N-terminal cleavage/methylation domain-containing protein
MPKSIKTLNNGGYTIIEVLLALAIFSIGFMAMGALQSSSLLQTGDIARKTEAWAVLEEQAEVLKAMPFYANENGIDDDGDGDTDIGDGDYDETDPLLVDNDPGTASTAFDQGPHDRARGRYQVHWRVEDDEPIPEQPATVLQGVPAGNYTVSKTITVAVTEPGGDPQTEALAMVEFVKTWAADGIP